MIITGGYTHFFKQGGSEITCKSTGPVENWLYCKISIDEQEMNRAFGDNATKRKQLILHEMGHVFGLAHSENKATIMYPSLANVTATKVTYADSAALIQKLGGV